MSNRKVTDFLSLNKRLPILFISCLTLFMNGCAGLGKTPADPGEKKDSVQKTEILSEKNWTELYQRVFTQAKKPNYEFLKDLGEGPHHYRLIMHDSSLAPLLSWEYSRAQLTKLENEIKPSLNFNLDWRGLARAADRVSEKTLDETHYDAVWVRDSLWVYLGLKATLPSESVTENEQRAKKLLLTLADYFSSPDQLVRFRAAIKDPAVVRGDANKMNAVHIRFDRNSPTFQDVQENGKAQVWNHKQNDALGLFLDLYCRAILKNEVKEADLNPAKIELLELIPKYFAAVRFYEMEDAGSWEEIERVNTSSVALATSGLERLNELVARKTPLTSGMKKDSLKHLIAMGYSRIRSQLAQGGESPNYPRNDPRHRTSDAALLNLIYPAQLKGLKEKDYQRILKALDPLIQDIGIKRYVGDSYQSGNFWFHQWMGAADQKSKTDDTSSKGSFENRGKQLIQGSEAEWFFDSWYSIAMSTLAKKSRKNAQYLRLGVQFMNRAVAQITSGTERDPMLGADGLPVQRRALPESYNTLVDIKTGEEHQVPSPITPLNWAKASLRIAMSSLLNVR